jgi:hypothetical protein
MADLAGAADATGARVAVRPGARAEASGVTAGAKENDDTATAARSAVTAGRGKTMKIHYR